MTKKTVSKPKKPKKRQNAYGPHGLTNDEVTTTTMGAPRAAVQSIGKCSACPDWRSETDLVNGRCVDHRFFHVPKMEAKRQREKKRKAKSGKGRKTQKTQ